VVGAVSDADFEKMADRAWHKLRPDVEHYKLALAAERARADAAEAALREAERERDEARKLAKDWDAWAVKAMDILGEKDAAEAALREAREEIARHHADFERWEQMAAEGAGKLAAIAARDALLDQALELTTPHMRIHEWGICMAPRPCRVEQWRRAVTELRGGTQ
jgi:hypothetical protein